MSILPEQYKTIEDLVKDLPETPTSVNSLYSISGEIIQETANRVKILICTPSEEIMLRELLLKKDLFSEVETLIFRHSGALITYTAIYKSINESNLTETLRNLILENSSILEKRCKFRNLENIIRF